MKLKNKNKYQVINSLREIEKAIKLYCYNCVGFNKRFDCEVSDCPLFNYRPWNKSKLPKLEKK